MNQATHLLRFFLSFAFLYILMPRLIFRSDAWSGTDKLVANFMRMVFLMMAAGFFLVLFKLWEVLSILTLLLILAAVNKWKSKSKDERSAIANQLAAGFFDWTESRRSLSRYFRGLAAHFITKIKRTAVDRFTAPKAWMFLIAFMTVFGISAYIRFYNALHHAAPSMSDSYVVLAWTNYIDERILFNDGVYPMGMHIILDSLTKFAFIDAVYIVNYAGPLHSLLITFSLYYAVSRFSGNRWAGLVAASIYGIFGHPLLGGGWERQAATISQEYAFIFILPSIYFYSRYLKDGRKGDLWAGFSGTAAAGLVNQVAFALTGLGIGVLLIVFAASDFRRTRKLLLWTTLSALGTVAIMLAQLGIGLTVLHDAMYSSAMGYVELKLPNIGLSILNRWDDAALAAIGITLIFGLISLGFKKRRLTRVYFSTALLGIAVFFIFYAGGHYTGSLLIANRSIDLWAIVIPFCIGIAVSILFLSFRRFKWKNGAQFGILALFLGIGIHYDPVQPIIPYKMMWDSEVAQYLKIAGLYRPKTWDIVSDNNGYAMTFNIGRHNLISNFVKNYDPNEPPLTKYGAAKPDPNIAPDVFLYDYKQIFKVSKTNSIYNEMLPTYKQRAKNRDALNQWIKAYEQANGKLDVFYDGPHLRIYHIHIKQSRKKIMKEIWGS